MRNLTILLILLVIAYFVAINCTVTETVTEYVTITVTAYETVYVTTEDTNDTATDDTSEVVDYTSYKGAISGTISDSVTYTGKDDLTVDLYYAYYSEDGGFTLMEGEEALATTTTANGGQFTFSDVYYGYYMILIKDATNATIIESVYPVLAYYETDGAESNIGTFLVTETFESNGFRIVTTWGTDNNFDVIYTFPIGDYNADYLADKFDSPFYPDPLYGGSETPTETMSFANYCSGTTFKRGIISSNSTDQTFSGFYTTDCTGDEYTAITLESEANSGTSGAEVLSILDLPFYLDNDTATSPVPTDGTRYDFGVGLFTIRDTTNMDDETASTISKAGLTVSIYKQNSVFAVYTAPQVYSETDNIPFVNWRVFEVWYWAKYNDTITAEHPEAGYDFYIDIVPFGTDNVNSYRTSGDSGLKGIYLGSRAAK